MKTSMLSLMIVMGALAAGAGAARAQTKSAEAEQLFRDGKKLMAAGDYERACEAFAGSARKEPLPSTMLNLADCREKNQQYASAWGAFVEAGRLARGDASLDTLRRTADERAAALEPRLSFLIINVSDEARIEGLTITRDGEPVDPATWNRDLPVDGGTYTIEAKAPAYESWSTTVKVAAAQDKQSVNVPRFAELAPLPAPAEVTPVPSGLGNKRKVALGLWAVGAAGLGAGLALELKSRATYDDALAATTSDRRHSLTDDANRQRTTALIAAGAGTLALGVGLYLWLDGKPHRADRVTLSPTLSPDGVAATVRGSF